MNTPTIFTQRLVLRPIAKADINDIYYGWMTDEAVSRYMFWKSSDDIKKTEEFVDYELSMLESGEWYRWLICFKDGTLLGTCLIYFNSDEKCWDISYNLGKKYWGNGYITEAMKCAIDFGVSRLGIDEFIAAHAVENPTSGRVIEKLGFKYEKDIPFNCNGGEIHTTGKLYRLKTVGN